jgi:hypothetical protein
MERSRILNRWTVAVLAVGLVGVLLLFRGFGLTWDETVQATYGEMVLDYFSSGFSDLRANEFADLRFYGPLFELTAAVVYRLGGLPAAETRHFLIGLTALAALIGVIRYAGLFRESWLPVYTGLALVSLPRFFGHAFNNSKDIPYACFFVWALWAIARIASRRSLGRSDILLAGLTIGLALAARPGGMLLFGYLAVGVGLAFLSGHRQGEWAPRSVTLRLLAVVAAAWALMVAFWPWAHQNPLVHPIRAFLEATSFSEAYPQLFEGRMVGSDQLPWYYLPKYLLITTPPVILVLFLVGLAVSVRRQIQEPRGGEARLWLLTQLWFFFPVVYVVVMGPNVYNGIRHFLFLLPAMAVLAGLGASYLASLGRQGITRRLVPGLLVVLMLLPAVDLVRLHPYQMTYFNFLAGGVGGAWERYDTDYWASSYREAALWINRHRRPGSRTVVLVAANDYNRDCFEYYLDSQVEVHTVWDPGDAVPESIDYFVGMTRLGTHKTFPEIPVAHRIERQGGVFTVIRGWRSP